MANIVRSYQTAEDGKFIELNGDSRFPAISVTRYLYKDDSDAFPQNQGLPPLTSVDVYPKYAVLTYNAGGVGGAGPGGSFTRCETRTSSNPSFISSKIFIHNSVNQDANVVLTLTSGLSCTIPIGKSSEANHVYTESLAVSGVNNYAGCSINFYA